jgi:26S proteasome regulatory subunit N6
MTESDSMELDIPVTEVTAADQAVTDEEEDVSDLTELFESTEEMNLDTSTEQKIQVLSSILTESTNRFGPKASSIKERSIYSLARTYCLSAQYDQVVALLTGATCSAFFTNVTKAKCAKVVRAVLEIVCSLAPSQLDMQQQICNQIIEWTIAEKRTFLRQRVQAKLASILFSQNKYGEALTLVDKLLAELKKLDDKQLLVETHLVESKIHHGLRNLPKAKAALTASRTCANAIYVAPGLQSSIDSMSGVLHCEEGDYNTAHSYFLEAFEQLDQLEGDGKAAEGSSLSCLKYMMLCKILDSLTKALKLSAKVGVGARTDKSEVDISGMISNKQGIKYAGRDIEAMTAIATASSRRSLKDYEAVTVTYAHELQDDILIKHHLDFLHEQLLESNLIRIVEPYSCVEIEHVAKLIEMPLPVVEKKLSQMILDGTLNGILDQGKGQLIVYDDTESDLAMEKGLQVIENMDNVVSSLFKRSHALRSSMA